MKYEPVTLKDIARALGLSKSTVSRALTNSPQINLKTRNKVIEYAKKINYRPNPTALGLKHRKSHSIGVIVSEIANNFFSQAIDGIESIAYDSGYHVFITQSNESVEKEKINLKHLSIRSIDGLLVSLSAQTKDITHFKELYDQGLPIVFFDRVTHEAFTHRVTIDNFSSAFEATEQLILSGYTNIAHLTASRNLSITEERLAGYSAALSKYGINFREENVKYCEFGGMILKDVENAVLQLLSQEDRPTAIFAANDQLTTGCLGALKKYFPGLAKNFKITGFTNSNLTDLFDSPLTIIRQPAFKMGQIATQLLLELIESKIPATEFQTRVLRTEMISRNLDLA